MRWRRMILAVVVGLAASAVAGLLYWPFNVYTLVHGVAAKLAPQPPCPDARLLVSLPLQGAVVALPGVVVAILIAATGR